MRASVVALLASLFLFVLSLFVLVPSCSSVPAVTELPSDPARPPAAAAKPLPPRTSGPVYRPLELRGVRGGEFRFRLPGRREDVVAMLLDFDHANGHRAWAKRYALLEREPDRVLARWVFKGKLGIKPTVEIEFRRSRGTSGTTLRFKLTKTAFGVAAFFGDHRVVPLSTSPPSVEVTTRVFIDSGLMLVNASKKDIEKGLRHDAELMREWMKARLSPGE